jgi:nucleoid DNA-binding protein
VRNANGCLIKKSLVEIVSSRHPHSRTDIAAIIDTALDVVAENLTAGKDAELRGLGVFRIVLRKGRTYKTPIGGVRKVPPKLKVKFTASKLITDKLEAT